jgi:rhodanese-related sulfurtransferase
MSSWLKDRLTGGKRADPRLSPSEARGMIEAGALVVDVREASELRQSGKLRGAKHVPVGMIGMRADPASAQRDPDFVTSLPVLLYCASGIRSASAARALRELGYGQAFNIGGLQELADAGLPLEAAESGR